MEYNRFILQQNNFDPYEFFGLNDKSIEELEKIANQETIKITLDDIQKVLEGENE